MEPATPDFLYHYTSINNFALILKNRTIRFSCLENLNDLTEGETSDLGRFGRYVFVSCWTETPDEHIPLWNMYTPSMAGVRIKLPSDPVERYEFIGDKSKGTFGYYPNSIVPEEEILAKNYMVYPASFKLHKVEYTDDATLLKPTIYKKTSGGESFQLALLGKHKPKEWLFEQEWRYSFWIVPSIPVDPSDKYYSKRHLRAVRSAINAKELPINQFFLKINDKAFEQMEVILGPKHTEGDIIMVDALIRTYNPKAGFELSTLKIK
jgi:hypothetical protein